METIYYSLWKFWAKATKEKEEKDIKDIENEYLEEFNNDDDKDYIDSFDADKECKPKDIIPDKLYAEIPDLESSCEQSQQENGLTINCEKSQDNDGDDMWNYGERERERHRERERQIESECLRKCLGLHLKTAERG